MDRNSTFDTFHLYHHQSSPLPEERVDEGVWLVNNGATYRRVATIQAHTPAEAWESALEKASGQGRRRRFVQMAQETPLRESQPGDVLVCESMAWMGMADGGLRALPYYTSRPFRVFQLGRSLQGVDFSPEGSYVAVAGSEVSLHTLYGEEDFRLGETTYRGHGDWRARALAWSSDGAYIASGGHESEVHVWRPAPQSGPGRAARGSILICRTDDVDAWRLGICWIAWAANSRSLYAARENGDVVWWNAIDGSCLGLTRCPLPGDVSAVAFSPNGARVAAGSRNGAICLWWSETGAPIGTLKQEGEVTAASWSPDGYLLATARDEDGSTSLAVWDASATSSTPRASIPLSVSFTAAPSALWLAWSPQGRYLAAGCSDGTLQVVDVSSQRHVLTYRAGTRLSISGLAWSPDGRWIATTDTGQYSGVLGALRVWPVAADLSSVAEQGCEGG